MVPALHPPALTRRRFLTLSAAAAAVPVVAGCGGIRVEPAGSGAPSLQLSVPAGAGDGVRSQVRTPLAPAQGSTYDPGLVTPAAEGLRADSLLVLSYHNVTADGLPRPHGRADHYTVAAAAFAAQMDMLRRSGFASVRIADVLDAQRTGRPLPPRSVLITFDDGGAGQWIYADPVLAAAGFTATTFVITGHLGRNPGQLTWDETVALAHSGRWDIGAHTHDHHHLVPSTASRKAASVLINRAWDPGAGRLQAAGDARAGFETDLDTSIRMLSRAGISRPQSFAYPFSQVSAPTNDPAFAAFVRGRLAATFPLLLTNTSPGRMARPQDLRAGMLPRLEVRHDMTTLDLYEQIRAADTIGGFGHIPGGRAGG